MAIYELISLAALEHKLSKLNGGTNLYYMNESQVDIFESSFSLIFDTILLLKLLA